MLVFQALFGWENRKCWGMKKRRDKSGSRFFSYMFGWYDENVEKWIFFFFFFVDKKNERVKKIILINLLLYPYLIKKLTIS